MRGFVLLNQQHTLTSAIITDSACIFHSYQVDIEIQAAGNQS